MQVKVKLFASLRKYLPEGAAGSQATLELPEGATVRDVLKQLQVPEEMARIVMIDGEHCPQLDQPLSEGQTLSIFPPMAGGQGEEDTRSARDCC